MKVRGLDGKMHSWVLKEHKSGTPSTYHERARAVLAKLYPNDNRLEEISLPGSGNLTLDFYLPTRKLAVEVQGQQHYEYSHFFHGHRVNFMKSQGRDCRKQQWCELNNITLIELPFNETDEQWLERLLKE